MVKASVIICTYNHLRYLKTVLPSVCYQSVEKEFYEVIAVNDGSTDGTNEYLEAIYERDNYLKIINNKTNNGLSISRNIGVDASQGKLLIFLDDDNVADYRLVEEYIKFNQSRPDAFYQGNQIFPDWILNNNFAREWASWVVPGNKKIELSDIPAKNICPGNFAISRKHFFAVNGFNRRFKFWGLEDGEFAYRVKDVNKISLMFVEKAITYHIDESFTYAVYLRKYKSIGKNALPILRKHCQGFIDLTNYNYIIEEINQKDDITLKVKKGILRLFFYSPLPYLLQKVLLLVDDIPWVNIFRRFYKLGLSYSVWKGYREYKRGKVSQNKWF